MVPVEQLEDVRALLVKNVIPHWADESAISLDGQPAITVVNLGLRADPEVVQRILDHAE